MRLDSNEGRDDWMQQHQPDHLQITCTLLQTDNHAYTSSIKFYRLNALSDTQPTVSKYQSQYDVY